MPKLYAFVLLLTLSISTVSQSPRIGSKVKHTYDQRSQSRATGEKSGALRLITSEFFAFEEPLTLMPSDPTILETRQSPTLVSVVIPRDDKRTYLFLSLGGIPLMA
jgi:hypothetical protein